MELNNSEFQGTVGERPQFLQSHSRLKLSTMSILSAIGNRFFNKTQEESRKMKSEKEKSDTMSVHSNKSSKSSKSIKSIISNKSKHEEPVQKMVQKTEKPKLVLEKKPVFLRKKQDSRLEVKYKVERDFRKFRSKYNHGLGNIVRNWMNLIYCVLILRMNVVKLVLQRMQDSNPEDCELEQQIRFESQIIYNMVRKAQHYSQERSLFLWNELEKLIMSRSVIRSALEEVHDKEVVLRDWKGMAMKLEQAKKEADRLKAEADALKRMKLKTDEQTKAKLAELYAAEEAKDQELQRVLQQISEMKRKELQLRGKILLNMKYYQDLKVKKQNLLNIEKELMQLKDEQMTVAKEYTDKIEGLKNEIEEKDRLIKAEKEEKRKLKENLKGLGDQSLNNIIKDD